MIRKKATFIGALLVSLLALGFLTIYFFFPQLYTDPNSGYDFNSCKHIGNPITPSEHGEKCTAPNGNTYYSSWG
jgi:hypothetical protein